MAAKGGYKTALKQSAASAGVLKPVQPGENTLVVRTTYNGRHRLGEARDHGMLRRIVPVAFGWLVNRSDMRSYCSVDATTMQLQCVTTSDVLQVKVIRRAQQVIFRRQGVQWMALWLVMISARLSMIRRIHLQC